MNQTEQFLGEQTEWPAAALQLHALQGLWGGRIIPHETLSQLSLTNSQGTITTYAQWQTNSHPIFDSLSAAILKLESQTETLLPVYAGPYS